MLNFIQSLAAGAVLGTGRQLKSLRRQRSLLVIPVVLVHILSIVLADSDSLAAEGCQGCLARRQTSIGSGQDDEWRQLRIESTKQLILERLDMHHRPKVKSSRVQLPAAIFPTVPDEDDAPDDPLEIRQVILYPSQIRHPTRRRNRSVKVGLIFPITEEMRSHLLNSAVLWTPTSDMANLDQGIHYHFTSELYRIFSIKSIDHLATHYVFMKPK